MRATRLAYKLHGFFDETIQKIVDTVSDLLRLLFFVLRGDQIIKSTVDQGQLGDVVVDAEDADGGPVVVADVDGGGLENLSVLRLGQVAQVVLKLLPVAPQGLQHHV